ncbi:MAG: M56 family metallopeptidase [Pirellulales bacterium]
MNVIVDSLAYWLADFYLLATVLLAAALASMAICSQPAKRLAVAKAAIVAAALLAGLCALPGWSLFSLRGANASDTTNINGLPPATTIAELPRGLELEPSPQATPALPQVASLPAATKWEIPWLAVLVGGYTVGSTAIAAWLVAGAVAAARLVKRADYFPDELRRALGEEAGLGQLLVSSEIDVPVALGIMRPRVMLPHEWIATRTPAELKTVLAHEAAHIRNRDLQWLAASRLLLVALWAQPLYWWLRRRMRLDQETLADAAAAEVAGRQVYAEQLVAWARDVVPRRQLLPASVGLWEGTSQLRRRVVVLLDERFTVLRSWSLFARSAVLMTAGVAALGLSLITLQPNDVSAESTDATSATEDSEGSLTYSGTVVDKRSEKPVAGATVKVRLQTSGTHPWKTLSETTRETETDGRFEFTIPQELAADSHLYIELDVAHEDHAPVTGFGYALNMIRKNEKLGGRPFFDRIPLEPAAPIEGIVRTPVGDAAADVSVVAFSAAEEMPVGDFGHSWSRGKTDAQGKFRLNVVKQGKAILWLLPTEYAQQTHVLGERRGDLGTMALEDGMQLSGRVVDRKGEPIAGIWVNAELVYGPAKQPLDLPVVDSIRRSALTDADGKFELAPLPAGTFRVLPEENPVENPQNDRQPRPLADVFLPQRVELVAGKTPPPIDISAVETVTIEAQIYDSAGKRRGGHEVNFFGRRGDEAGEYYFADGRPDADGHIEFQVPKGLRDARLTLIGNEHQALRYRWTAAGPLESRREIELGDLQRDRRGLEIVYFTAPILIVRARNEQGNAIPEFKPAVFYQDSVKPRDVGSRWLSGISGEVAFERQADGRWRSELLLPDEAFFVTVAADGYEPVTESLLLEEGVTKEIDVTLRKAGDASAQPAVGSEGVESGKTSGAAGTQHQSLGDGKATVVKFSTGNPATPWDFEPNAVRLEIEDAEGNPVTGAEATLLRVTRATGEREQLREAATDAQGAIEFRDAVDATVAAEIQAKVQRGEYSAPVRANFYVVLKKPGFGTVILPITDFTVASRGWKRRVRMRPAAELSGLVTDASGKPVAGATVAAGAFGGILALEGANAIKTDGAGRYRFTNLVAFDRAAGNTRTQEQMKLATAANPSESTMYPSVYDPVESSTVTDLVVTHPDFAVTTASGGNVPGETNVVMKPAAAIEGRVIEFASGKPAAGVLVKAIGRLASGDGNDVVFAPVGGLPQSGSEHMATTRTDAAGRYRLANPPAGSYDVWAEGGANDPQNVAWVSTSVGKLTPTPGANPLKIPDLVIGPGGTIRGRLVDASTGKPLDLAGMDLTVRAWFLFLDGTPPQMGQLQEAAVDDNGRFTLRAYPARVRAFVDVRRKVEGGPPASEYRSPDDFERSGQVFDLQHGESIETAVPVLSTQCLEQVRGSVQRGFEALQANDKSKAIQEFSKAIAISPSETSALGGRAQAYNMGGQFAEAIGDYKRLVELGPDAFMSENNLAELLATSPNEADRDGARAVELAKRAVALAEAAKLPATSQAEFLDTLAAAQAEAGDFEAAVKTQREAIEKAPEGAKAKMRKRLEAYEAGKAWRREVTASVPE